MQRKNPFEDIKETLKQQENELRLLRELFVKEFDLQAGRPYCGPVSVTDDHEINRFEVENNNTAITDNQGPELPLPVPDLI